MAGSDKDKAEWLQRVLGVSAGGASGDVALPYSPVALGKAAIEWRTLCARSTAELAKLKQAIVDAYSGDDWDEEETEEVVEKVELLNGALAQLDENLADTVDAFLNSGVADKDAAMKEVMAEIAEYERLVQADELLRDVDNNEFLSTGLQARAMQALAALRQGFAKAA